MHQQANQKSFFITGASSGLGYELARQLAESGHLVIASARNLQALKELSVHRENLIPVQFDVTQNSEFERVRQEILQHSKQIDCVILNAGTCEYFDLDNPDWRMFDRVMSVNFSGVVHSMEALFPLLASNAHISVVSSMATFAPFTRSEAYGASKAAIDYFVKSMQMDLLQSEMDITLVSPGFIDTPLTQKNDFAMPFLMTAEMAAKEIIEQLDKRPRQIVFPKRFAWFLKSAAFFPAVWFKLIAPRLVKKPKTKSVKA